MTNCNTTFECNQQAGKYYSSDALFWEKHFDAIAIKTHRFLNSNRVDQLIYLLRTHGTRLRPCVRQPRCCLRNCQIRCRCVLHRCPQKRPYLQVTDCRHYGWYPRNLRPYCRCHLLGKNPIHRSPSDRSVHRCQILQLRWISSSRRWTLLRSCKVRVTLRTSLRDLGQSCSCYALANSLEVVVGRVELHWRNLWELGLEHLLCLGQHDVATGTLAHPTENHDVINLVELRVLRQAISQIHTDGLIDQTCTRLLRWIGHGLLDQLQALCMIIVLDGAHGGVWVDLILWSLDPPCGGQLRGASLAQIHVGNTIVRALRPWVTWSHRIQIQPDVTEFVDPTHQIAVGVCVATAF